MMLVMVSVVLIVAFGPVALPIFVICMMFLGSSIRSAGTRSAE